MAHKQHGTAKDPYMDPLPGPKPKKAGPLSASPSKKSEMLRGKGTMDKSGGYGGQLAGHEGNAHSKKGGGY